jgi:DNA-directed RNA polymerase specialized sigma24 family protein
VLSALPRVYAAAVAATGDPDAAEEVTERVLLADPAGDTDVLVERAVRLAVRTSPDAAFTPMRQREREVIALARLAGATTARIAALLAIEPVEVRSLMCSGLGAISRDAGRRTQPPPPGCGSAASRGHVARAS